LISIFVQEDDGILDFHVTGVQTCVLPICFSVVPVITGNSIVATMLIQNLLERGINVLPIIHPAVPEKSARLRFFLTSEHEEQQVRDTVAITAEELIKLQSERSSLRELAVRLAMPKTPEP